MTELPTASQIADAFEKGNVTRLGMGTHRACYRIDGTPFCVKGYRTDEEIALGRSSAKEFEPLSPGVIRAIRRSRFNPRRNTCRLEASFHARMKKFLPSELFAVFPEVAESVFLPSRGWCLLESFLADVVPFRSEYKAGDDARRDVLLSAFGRLISGLARNRVRFYDPQNILVQRNVAAPDGFRLRIADFEPVSRNLIPLDVFFPALVPMKVRRRARRYLSEQLGVASALREFV